MSTTLIAAILQLLNEAGPLLGSSASIAKAIAMLEEILPVVIKEAKDLLPMVKDAIATLSMANTATTADQLAQLAAMDAQVDAAFDAAAAAN
jgi:hypothetical protein